MPVYHGVVFEVVWSGSDRTCLAGDYDRRPYVLAELERPKGEHRRAGRKPILPQHDCPCGCGLTVANGRRYARGHAPRRTVAGLGISLCRRK